MALIDNVKNDMTAAMKAGDKAKVSALRMLISAVKYAEIEKRGKPFTDEDVQSVTKTLCKQRKESIEQFKAGGRTELAEKEEAELKVLEAYLPKQLPEAEVEAIIRKTVEEVGAKGPADMGKLMKPVMAKLKGAADGKLVQELVKKVLGA
ncbi:MAG: GatB/YqeY domain-containing protein [Deltaproteobacteria bacterium]|nr:GatB/YqeY domain-containing protein [Deltaproteobacteria bacterium]